MANDAEIDKAMFEILELARENNWEFIWSEGTIHNNGKRALCSNDPQSVYIFACKRMLHDKAWIRQDKGFRYAVTEEGRFAVNNKRGLARSLSTHSQGVRESSPEPRYGIFISSTFMDLREDRQEVMRSVMELDCFPLGMELFGAASNQPWEIIEREIALADYYVLVMGVRYGSLCRETGISFTEREFNYAIEHKKPVLAFLINEKEMLPEYRKNEQTELSSELHRFRKKVEASGLTVAYWSSKHELGKHVATSLTKEFRRNPQPGWIRGTADSTKIQPAKAQETKDDVDLRLRIQYQEAEIRPTLPQYQFKLEVLCTSRISSSISRYKTTVSLPTELAHTNSQTGKRLFDNSDQEYTVFQFPQNPGKDEQVSLMNGSEETVASVLGILHRENLPNQVNINKKVVAVKFFADGLKPVTATIPMSQVDPFRLCKITPNDSNPTRNKYLDVN